MTTGYREHSLWLLPSEPNAEKLSSVIRLLAKDFEAVDFEPHVTLSCVPSSDKEFTDIAHDLGSRFSQLSLTALRLEHTERYTKTLFLQFAPSAVAQEMSDLVKSLSSRPTNYRLNPHLSLLYKTMPKEEQQALSTSLVVPLGEYHFDRLRVIETEIPLTRPEQIRRWRTVCEVPLAPRPINPTH